MNRQSIVVTGAAGFIGSDLVGVLNGKGYTDLILVDEFGDPAKEPNLQDKAFAEKVEREVFFDWLEANRPAVSFVFHIGARTDTTEFDYAIHERLNVQYSKKIWDWCTQHAVPLVYASSAATYGSGERGLARAVELLQELSPGARLVGGLADVKRALPPAQPTRGAGRLEVRPVCPVREEDA